MYQIQSLPHPFCFVSSQITASFSDMMVLPEATFYYRGLLWYLKWNKNYLQIHVACCMGLCGGSLWIKTLQDKMSMATLPNNYKWIQKMANNLFVPHPQYLITQSSSNNQLKIHIGVISTLQWTAQKMNKLIYPYCFIPVCWQAYGDFTIRF